MILTVILILLAVLYAGSLESNLTETFNSPEWMDIKDWEERQ